MQYFLFQVENYSVQYHPKHFFSEVDVVDINKSSGCSEGARDTAQIQLQLVGEEGAATACSFSFLIVAKMDSFHNQ